MFKGKITFDDLIVRYPPSVAQYLIEEIEKADDLVHAAANEDPVNDMMRDEWVARTRTVQF
jgi:hypothetical protein